MYMRDLGPGTIKEILLRCSDSETRTKFRSRGISNGSMSHIKFVI